MSRKCTSELRVRLTDAEYMQIQNNAAMCGLTISDYIRKLIREEPLIQKPIIKAVAHYQELQRFRADLQINSSGIPEEKRESIMLALDRLVAESKSII